MAGAELAGSINISDITAATCVTLFSVNFIYSFNSWADIDIDKISKPYRPIPSGRLKPDQALFYTYLLLILSLIYPFFLFSTLLPICLCLVLPLLGILYSARPVRLRDRPFASVFVLSIGLNIPMMTGFYSNSTDVHHIFLFLIIGLYCLGVVPLKKIEEVNEDREKGFINLYELWRSTLFTYSYSMLCLAMLLLIILPLSLTIKTFAAILMGSTLITIMLFTHFSLNLKILYNTIIRVVIVESITFIIYIKMGFPC